MVINKIIFYNFLTTVANLSNRKLTSKGKNRMIFLLHIFTCILVTVYTSKSYRSFISPNYRTISAMPPNATTNECWVITKMTLPSNWTPSSPPTFPVISNGTIGLSVDFVVLQTGLYTIRFVLDTSQTTQTRVKWEYNLTYFGKANNFSTFQMDMPDTWSAGSQSLYIWLEPNLILNSVQIIHQRTVSMSLVYTPSTLILDVMTDLPIAYLKNATELTNLLLVQLIYRKNLTSQCLHSNISTTNPAHWTSYKSTTNYTTIAAGYIVKLINSSNNFSLQVSNIQMDCSVNVSIIFPDGPYLIDNFTTTFIQNIDQNYTSIQSYLPVSLNYSLVYYISPKKLYIYFPGLIMHNGTNMPILDIYGFIKIDGGICSALYLSNNVTFNKFHVCCLNSTLFLKRSTVILSFPNNYFRDPITNSLFQFNITVQTARQFVNETVINITVTYYEQTQKLSIIYQIPIQQNWRPNLTTNSTEIRINTIKIPTTSIIFINNTNNFIEVEMILLSPFLVSDVLNVTFNSFRKRYCTPEGYYNWWYINPGYTVDRIPGNSTTNSTILIPLPIPTPAPIIQNQQSSLELKSEFVKNAHLPLVMVYYAEAGWSLFVFGYFINNFIGFQNLAFLYYFVGFKNVVNDYRKELAEAILVLNQQTNYQEVLNMLFRSDIFLYIINPESDFVPNATSHYDALTFRQAQFSSDFLQSCFENLVLISLAFVKLAVIRLLIAVVQCDMLRTLLGRVYAYGPLIVLFEVLMSASQIYLSFGISTRASFQMGYAYFLHKLNFFLIIVMRCACIFAVVLIFHLRFYHSKTASSKSGFEKQEFSSRFSLKTSNVKTQRQFLHLLDNSLYICVPFLVGTGNSSIFVLAMTLLTTFRLCYVICKRRVFRCGQFLKQLINKSIWFLFNLVYAFYWATQLLQIDCSQRFIHQILVWSDMAETGLLLGGCVFEMAVNFLAIIISIAAALKNLIIRTKISQASNPPLKKSPTPQIAIVQNYKKTSTLKQSSGPASSTINPISPALINNKRTLKIIHKLPHSKTTNLVVKSCLSAKNQHIRQLEKAIGCRKK